MKGYTVLHLSNIGPVSNENCLNDVDMNKTNTDLFQLSSIFSLDTYREIICVKQTFDDALNQSWVQTVYLGQV